MQKAYRKALIKYHPDKQGDDEEAREKAAVHFKEATHAHKVLSNPELRIAYHELIGLCWKIEQGI